MDGEFTALPDFVERAMCVSCAVTPFYTAPERPRVKASPTEALPAHILSAIALGERVAHYLSTLAREEEASTKLAVALYPESTYTETKDVAGLRLAVALGYLNHDYTLFTPPAAKRVDPTTGEEESAAQALGRTRLEYGERARRSFLDFVGLRPELVAQLEEAYNRLFRGYVAPDYSGKELQIARWRGRIVLKPHQIAGALRLIANLGGLLGFDTGVGKTFTGTATIASLRELGRARRPIVVVPNTLLWKWHKDIRAALPDYRVGVVGSERYIGRHGVYTSRIDTPQERATKWRQFQAGEFDVMLVTYSVFARNSIRAESVRA